MSTYKRPTYSLESLLAIVTECHEDYQMAIDDCVYDEYDVERLNSAGDEYFYHLSLLDAAYPVHTCRHLVPQQCSDDIDF